jgi:hypothetical protein
MFDLATQAEFGSPHWTRFELLWPKSIGARTKPSLCSQTDPTTNGGAVQPGRSGWNEFALPEHDLRDLTGGHRPRFFVFAVAIESRGFAKGSRSPYPFSSPTSINW